MNDDDAKVIEDMLRERGATAEARWIKHRAHVRELLMNMRSMVVEHVPIPANCVGLGSRKLFACDCSRCLRLDGIAVLLGVER